MIGTQAAYARHAEISKQAVNKLVKQGKIPLREDGKIDFAAADHARRVNADPARKLTADPEPIGIGLADEPAPEAGGPSFSQARTERETYAAQLAKLEYERQVGLWLPKREVEDAMVASGRKVRQGLDGIVAWADELDAAARNGGADAVRTVLKERVRALESMIVESLNLLADDDES